MAWTCRMAPRHYLTKGSRSLNRAIRTRACAAWPLVSTSVGKPSRDASSVHSPGTWNCATAGVATSSNVAAKITDRIITPKVCGKARLFVIVVWLFKQFGAPLPRDGDRCEPRKSEATPCRWSQINDPAANERTAVVNTNRDRTPVARMFDSDARAERQCSMGGRHRVWIGAFAACGLATAVGED